jgi:hypothetical protein
MTLAQPACARAREPPGGGTRAPRCRSLRPSAARDRTQGRCRAMQARFVMPYLPARSALPRNLSLAPRVLHRLRWRTGGSRMLAGDSPLALPCETSQRQCPWLPPGPRAPSACARSARAVRGQLSADVTSWGQPSRPRLLAIAQSQRAAWHSKLTTGGGTSAPPQQNSAARLPPFRQ